MTFSKKFTFNFLKFDTQKLEVLNSLILKITANENDAHGMLQRF